MKRQRNFFFVIAYLALAISMFYFNIQDVTVGSFGFQYKYLFGIGIILLSMLHFLISADLRAAIRCLKDSAALMYPYLFTLAYSLVLWLCTMAGFRTITRGTFYIVYQMIAILAAAGALYMFGKKGIYLQFAALVCALLLVAAEQIRLVGLGEFVRQYVVNITSFTRNSGTTMRTFEKGEYCYAVGFYLAYFVLTMKEKRSHILLAAVSFLLFFLGLKRSVLLGVCSAILFGLLIGRARNPKKLIVPLFTVGACLAICYIVWIYTGLFDWLESIGVSTSGRNWIYSQIRDYYQMSPLYMGKGAGFVARAFSDGVIDLTARGYTVGDIHNDYLRQYIEFGFLGCLVWFWLYTTCKVKHFFHGSADEKDNRRGVLALAMTVVACATCLTENAIYCYYLTVCMAVTIMGYDFETFVERTKLPGE